MAKEMRLGFENRQIVYKFCENDPKEKYSPHDVQVLGFATESPVSYEPITDVFTQSEIADAIKKHHFYSAVEVSF